MQDQGQEEAPRVPEGGGKEPKLAQQGMGATGHLLGQTQTLVPHVAPVAGMEGAVPPPIPLDMAPLKVGGEGRDQGPGDISG